MTAIATKAKRIPLPTVDQVLDIVERSLDDDLAEDVRVIPLAGKTSIADYMVVASGASARKIDAMADHLIYKLKHSGLGRVAAEGRDNKDWVLVDAGDVIVHLFRPEVRAHYDLEKLWEAELSERPRLRPLSA